LHSPLLGQYCFQARLGAGLPGRGLAVNAFAKSNGVQLGVRRLLFVEIRGQEADDNIVAELLGPCDERTVATDFVVLAFWILRVRSTCGRMRLLLSAKVETRTGSGISATAEEAEVFLQKSWDCHRERWRGGS